MSLKLHDVIVCNVTAPEWEHSGSCDHCSNDTLLEQDNQVFIYLQRHSEDENSEDDCSIWPVPKNLFELQKWSTVLTESNLFHNPTCWSIWVKPGHYPEVLGYWTNIGHQRRRLSHGRLPIKSSTGKVPIVTLHSYQSLCGKMKKYIFICMEYELWKSADCIPLKKRLQIG